MNVVRREGGDGASIGGGGYVNYIATYNNIYIKTLSSLSSLLFIYIYLLYYSYIILLIFI